MRAEAVAPSRPDVIELFDVDAIGNRVADWRHESVGVGPLHLENTHYYYGSGDELRLTNRHVGVGSGSDVGGLFEEYRYDALGRRVLTRSRSTVAGCGSAPSTPCAQSYMERTVWDGDQVLAEIRAPGGDEVASSAWESDSPSYTTLSGGTVYGRVTYTHALGALDMDAPVAVTRTGLSEGVRLVFPHANWRGEVASGSVPSSGDPCGHGAAVCPAITWPGRALATDGAPMAGSTPPVSWWGSLMERKRDGSGLQYMRNRYYDAATGKFTQVDPVGIAGGVNLYGFAEGDPVNYSDPLGLCPFCLGGIIAAGEGAAAGAAAAIAATAAMAAKADEISAAVGSAVDALRDKLQVKFVTYTRTGPNGQVYSGRTRGFGNPQSIVNARVAGHPARLSGFGPAVLDRWATGLEGYQAIRGREQQLIDAHGGAQSDGGTSANLIRGVSRINPAAGLFDAAAITMFGRVP